MNKREKEVLQLPLDKEKAVLKQLEAEYRQALADVNMRIRLLLSDEMTVSRVYHLEYQKTIKKQVEAILEKLHSDEFSTIEQFLAESYVDGYVKTGYLLYDQGVPVITPIDQQAVVDAIQNETKLKESLYDELGYDVDELKKTITSEITRGVATGLQYTDIARNIANRASVKMSRAKTIARTEAARIQEKATMDAAYKAQAKGADVLKQWSAIFDGKTRPHHRELDGQIRELNEPFTIGTKKAMQPCDFGDAAEDCNCRCTSLIKSRRSLERSIRKRDNFSGELLEFETAKDYEEFKKRYFSEENVKFMKYAEELEEKHHVERLDDLWDMMTKDERERFLELKNASPMWKTTGQNTAETLINKGKSGIINTKRKAFTKVNVEDIPPMDGRTFERIKANLERKGVKIIQDEDGDAFLGYMKAEALTLSDGTGIIFQSGRIPSASAVYEELIHVNQIRRGGMVDSSDKREYLRREIEANEKVLKNKKAYKLTELDVESIENNLAGYYRELKELGDHV